MIRTQKRFIVLALLLIGMLLVVSCAAQKPKAPEKPAGPPQCVPEWVENPVTAEDGVYGYGNAKMQTSNLSKTAADSRARDEVVRSIQVKVNNMIKDFSAQYGPDEGGQLLGTFETVSKQVASYVLTGCKIVKRKVCPDGTWHSLAQWPIGQADQLKKELKDRTKNSLKNEEALYNQFKAKQGFEELDKEIDKLDLTGTE